MKHEITAELSEGLATVEIDGEMHKFESADENELRRLVVKRTAEYAEEVKASYVVVNTTDAEGKEQFGVTPEGKIIPIEDEEKPAAKEQPMGDAEPVKNPYVAEASAVPTVDDFLQAAPPVSEGPAEEGWRGAVVQATGLRLNPSKIELRHREAKREVQKSYGEPKTVAAVNVKGGVGKTSSTLELAEKCGTLRGGSVLAWDVNETRGNMGLRAPLQPHNRTVVDLIENLHQFDGTGRVGDLDRFVRSQGEARFDVLASDERPGAKFMISGEQFNDVHAMLQKYYRLMFVDTGNNMVSSNWVASVEAADELVICASIAEDSASTAAWLIDGLRQLGHEEKIANAVTIIQTPHKMTADHKQLHRRLTGHFKALTRELVEIPYSDELSLGGRINFANQSKEMNEAWLYAAEAVSKGL